MPDLGASAAFSSCRQHRHVLSRWWSDEPRALVCGCNPSDAGEERNDPTVRAIIALLRDRPGVGGFDLVNFGTRITADPKAFDLWRADAWSRDPLAYERAGHENRARIRALAAGAAVRIIAWGRLVTWSFEVQHLLGALSLDGAYPLHAFALTRDGAPRHPLARGRERILPGRPLVVWRAGRDQGHHAPESSFLNPERGTNRAGESPFHAMSLMTSPDLGPFSADLPQEARRCE